MEPSEQTAGMQQKTTPPQIEALMKAFETWKAKKPAGSIESYSLVLLGGSDKQLKDKEVVIFRSATDRKFYVFESGNTPITTLGEYLLKTGYKNKRYYDNKKGSWKEDKLKLTITPTPAIGKPVKIRVWTHYDTIKDSSGGADEYSRGSRMFRPELGPTELKGTVAGPKEYSEKGYVIYINIPNDKQNSGFYRFTSTG